MSEPGKPNVYRSVKYRLSDEDRAKFGGPEWVTFDRRELFKLDAAELMKIEAGMNMTIGQFFAASAQSSILGTKAMIWIARRFAGMKEEFSEFNPHPFECESEIVHPESEAEVPQEENPTGTPSNTSDSPE